MVSTNSSEAVHAILLRSASCADSGAACQEVVRILIVDDLLAHLKKSFKYSRRRKSA